MPPLVPDATGLTIGGVFYRYTIDKDPNSASQVHIQNQDAINGGLLYRNTDDWSGLPGNTITNSFGLPNIPLQYFGQGSIEVEGDGTISDPNIIYTYKYDTCFNPINDPSCPGYAEAMNKFLIDNGLLNNQIEINDPLNDPFVIASLEREVKRDEEENEETDTEEDEEEEEVDLEEALAAVENALAIAEGAADLASLNAMANIPQFNSYLQTTIPGGIYNDSLSFEPKEIPDNRNGLRVGLAQQILHQEMVDSQYQLGYGN